MGTFWMFAAITIVGGIWVWLQIPETAGISLESMDALFKLPWYKIGLKGRRFAEGEWHLEQQGDGEERNTFTDVEHVENPESTRG